jgi:glycosyltransferase involved in cell wall biosynthesis
MANKKVILFTIPTLDSLGAQRVLLTILKYINFADNYQVKLLVISKTGNFKNEIPSHIEVIAINDYIFGIPKIRVLELLFYGYYRALSRINPSIVISFVPFTNFACFLPKLLFNMKFKLIISEHAHVSGAISDSENMDNYFQKIYLKFFKKVYNSKLVDKIIVIAKESKDDLEEVHKIQESKMVLINNPLDHKLVISKSLIKPDADWFSSFTADGNFVIINSGRLVFQKRQDLLIEAFAEVYKKFKHARLVILGGGDDTKLLNIIKELKLESVVKLAGFQNNPWSFIARSKLFVLSSCWEGLPCVIAETMALKIPIVSTNCPSGPTEMLESGRLGLLCNTNDVVDLSNKIEEAINDYDQMLVKAEKALESIYRYDSQLISKEYETTINSLLI